MMNLVGLESGMVVSRVGGAGAGASLQKQQEGNGPQDLKTTKICSRLNLK